MSSIPTVRDRRYICYRILLFPIRVIRVIRGQNEWVRIFASVERVNFHERDTSPIVYTTHNRGVVGRGKERDNG